ncbi:MAG: nucleoside monophosphate kinase, partial [Elusimicrobiota bacterium]
MKTAVNRLNRTISWILTISFVVVYIMNNYSYVSAAAFNILPAAKQIQIPLDYGSVIESYNPGAVPGRVILIQDLHTNYEVQNNISNILDFIDENYGIGSIGVEGNSSDVDVSLASTIPHDEVKARVIEYFMTKGLVSGPEKFVSKKKDPVLKGIDDKDLYEQDGRLLVSSLNHRAEFVEILERIKYTMKTVEAKICSPDLRRFRDQYVRYRQHGITPHVFHENLLKWAEKGGKTVREISPEYANFILLTKKEHAIDYRKVEKEYKKLLEQMGLSDSEGGIRAGIKKFMDVFRVENSLRERIFTEIYSGNGYSNLKRYIECVEISRSNNPYIVVLEENRVVEEVSRLLAADEVEEAYVFTADYIQLLVKFLMNQLAREELDEFYKRVDGFEEQYRILVTEYPEEYRLVGAMLDTLKPYVEEMGRFYDIAQKREERFIDTFIEEDKREENRVMVMGGFHTRGVAGQLKKRGIPYTVIKPGITSYTEEDRKNYYSIIRGEEIVSYEEVLSHLYANPTLFKKEWFKKRLVAASVSEMLRRRLESRVYVADNEVSRIKDFIKTWIRGYVRVRGNGEVFDFKLDEPIKYKGELVFPLMLGSERVTVSIDDDMKIGLVTPERMDEIENELESSAGSHRRKLRLLIIGPPAAGKGTFSKMISSDYGNIHISMGDLLRDVAEEKTSLGRKVKDTMAAGGLVNDEVVIDILKNRLRKDDIVEKGFILDGFPRTIEQAGLLDELLGNLKLPINAVVNLEVPEEELLKRIAGRLICPDCGAVYNIQSVAPEQPGICDKCGASLVEREDDKPETVKKRLDAFRQKTAPLLDFYNKQTVINCDVSSNKAQVNYSVIRNLIERTLYVQDEVKDNKLSVFLARNRRLLKTVIIAGGVVVSAAAFMLFGTAAASITASCALGAAVTGLILIGRDKPLRHFSEDQLKDTADKESLETLIDFLAEKNREQFTGKEDMNRHHGLPHSLAVWNELERLADRFSADKEVLAAASFLHDIGIAHTLNERHGIVSADVAGKILLDSLFPENKIEQVLTAIREHDDYTSRRDTIESQLLFYADCKEAFGADGLDRYLAIYRERGVPETELYPRILSNIKKRYDSVSNKELKAILKSGYEEIRSIIHSAMGEVAYGKSPERTDIEIDTDSESSAGRGSLSIPRNIDELKDILKNFTGRKTLSVLKKHGLPFIIIYGIISILGQYVIPRIIWKLFGWELAVTVAGFFPVLIISLGIYSGYTAAGIILKGDTVKEAVNEEKREIPKEYKDEKVKEKITTVADKTGYYSVDRLNEDLADYLISNIVWQRMPEKDRKLLESIDRKYFEPLYVPFANGESVFTGEITGMSGDTDRHDPASDRINRKLKLIPIDTISLQEEVLDISAVNVREQIEKKGFFTFPIIVDKSGLVLDGSHRMAAMKQLGYKYIPAYVIDMKKDLSPEGIGVWYISPKTVFPQQDIDELLNKYRFLEKTLNRDEAVLTYRTGEKPVYYRVDETHKDFKRIIDASKLSGIQNISIGAIICYEKYRLIQRMMIQLDIAGKKDMYSTEVPSMIEDGQLVLSPPVWSNPDWLIKVCHKDYGDMNLPPKGSRFVLKERPVNIPFKLDLIETLGENAGAVSNNGTLFSPVMHITSEGAIGKGPSKKLAGTVKTEKLDDGQYAYVKLMIDFIYRKVSNTGFDMDDEVIEVIDILAAYFKEGRIVVFDDIVKSDEDYLLAFADKDRIAVSRNFFNGVIAEHLDEILFHEVSELIKQYTYGGDFHRAAYEGKQRKIFDPRNPLKVILRNYINIRLGKEDELLSKRFLGVLASRVDLMQRTFNISYAIMKKGEPLNPDLDVEYMYRIQAMKYLGDNVIPLLTGSQFIMEGKQNIPENMMNLFLKTKADIDRLLRKGLDDSSVVVREEAILAAGRYSGNQAIEIELYKKVSDGFVSPALRGASMLSLARLGFKEILPLVQASLNSKDKTSRDYANQAHALLSVKLSPEEYRKTSNIFNGILSGILTFITVGLGISVPAEAAEIFSSPYSSGSLIALGIALAGFLFLFVAVRNLFRRGMGRIKDRFIGEIKEEKLDAEKVVDLDEIIQEKIVSDDQAAEEQEREPVEVVIPKEKAVFRLDGNGKWWNVHGVFENKKISNYFHSSIKKDEKGYYVGQENGNVYEKVYFHYEDTALFAFYLIKDGNRMLLELNNKVRIELDKEKLFIKHDCLYMKYGEETIKFSAEAMISLMDRIDYDKVVDLDEIILERIVSDAQDAIDRGDEPVAVFDINFTLLDNRGKMQRIIEEFAAENEDKYPDLKKQLVSLTEDKIVYDIKNSLRNIGLEDEKLLSEIEEYFFEKFFRGEFRDYDRPVPGAAEYVNRLHDMGVKIIYLTGNWESFRDTRAADLEKFGFPLDEKSVLMMKPDDDRSKTHVFKPIEIKTINEPVIAVFDDQPAVLNEIKKQLPAIKNLVFMDTIHISGSPQLDPGIEKISHYAVPDAGIEKDPDEIKAEKIMDDTENKFLRSTSVNRLQKVDDYLFDFQQYVDLKNRKTVMVDVGVGKDASTTRRLAGKFNERDCDAEVIGFDIKVPENIEKYEKEYPNFRFIKTDKRDFRIPLENVDVIRCFHVLIDQYYKPEYHMAAVNNMGKSLREGGILIAGNIGFGNSGIFQVYQKVEGKMVLRERVSFNDMLLSFGQITNQFRDEIGEDRIYDEVVDVYSRLEDDGSMDDVRPEEMKGFFAGELRKELGDKYNISYHRDSGFTVIREMTEYAGKSDVKQAADRGTFSEILIKHGISPEDHYAIISQYDEVSELNDRIEEIVNVIKEIERTSGIPDIDPGWQMSGSSRRAILKNYLRNSSMEISPDSVIPRPLQDMHLDLAKAEKWIRAQKEESEELGLLSEKLVKMMESGYVDIEAFEDQLYKILISFRKEIKSKPYLLVVRGNQPGSKWVYDLAREYGLSQALDIIDINDVAGISLLQDYIDKGITDMAVMDDVAFDGAKIAVSAGIIRAIAERKDINIHPVIPFMTREAEDKIKSGPSDNITIEVYKHHRIKTVKEELENTEFKDSFIKFYRQQQIERWPGYFQHRFYDSEHQPDQVIEGRILDRDGFHKIDDDWRRITSDSFMPYIDPVYGRGATNWLKERSGNFFLRYLGLDYEDIEQILSGYSNVKDLKDRIREILKVIEVIEKATGIPKLAEETRLSILNTYLRDVNRKLSQKRIIREFSDELEDQRTLILASSEKEKDNRPDIENGSAETAEMLTDKTDGISKEAKVLNKVIRDAENAINRGQEPVAVFDINFTLLDNRKKILAILQKYAFENKQRYPKLSKWVKSLESDMVVYDVENTLRNIGINDNKLIKEMQEYFFEKFFTDEFSEYEESIPGAVEYVNRLHDMGIKIVYLTANWESFRGIRTRSLKRFGFPVDKKAVLEMKPDDIRTKIHIFKTETLKEMKDPVIAVFDDQPAVLNHIKDTLPAIENFIFLNTIYTSGADSLAEGIFKINAYTEKTAPPADTEAVVEKEQEPAEDTGIPAEKAARAPPTIESVPARKLDDLQPALLDGDLSLHIDVSEDLKTLTYSRVKDDSGVFEGEEINYDALDFEEIEKIPSSYLLSPERYFSTHLKGKAKEIIYKIWPEGKRYTRYDGVTVSWDKELDRRVWTTNIDTLYFHRILKKFNVFNDSKIQKVMELGVGGGHLSTALAAKLPNLKELTITDISLNALKAAKRNLLPHLKSRGIQLHSYWGKGIMTVKEIADLIIINPPYIPMPEYMAQDAKDPYRGTGLIREILKEGIDKLNPDNPDAKIIINVSSLAKKDLEKYVAEFGDRFTIEPMGEPLEVPLKIWSIDKKWKDWLVKEGGLKYKKDHAPDEEPYWHMLQMYTIRPKPDYQKKLSKETNTDRRIKIAGRKIFKKIINLRSIKSGKLGEYFTQYGLPFGILYGINTTLGRIAAIKIFNHYFGTKAGVIVGAGFPVLILTLGMYLPVFFLIRFIGRKIRRTNIEKQDSADLKKGKETGATAGIRQEKPLGIIPVFWSERFVKRHPHFAAISFFIGIGIIILQTSSWLAGTAAASVIHILFNRDKSEPDVPAWSEEAPGADTYRSIFKWGSPSEFKHPNSRLYALLKDKLGMSDEDFTEKKYEG